jgi:hypothetical protein
MAYGPWPMAALASSCLGYGGYGLGWAPVGYGPYGPWAYGMAGYGLLQNGGPWPCGRLWPWLSQRIITCGPCPCTDCTDGTTSSMIPCGGRRFLM